MARRNRVAEVEDEDAVVVELAVVKAARFVDLNAELAAEPVAADASPAVTAAYSRRVCVFLNTQPRRTKPDRLAVAVV